jgi:hypothetical protein
MGPGWVAGSVRARLLAQHRLGSDGARDVASTGSFALASSRLAVSPYAAALAGASSVEDARHDIWAAALWNLRVLAGWLPPTGVEAMRAFAGLLEIENIETLLVLPRDDRSYDLGALATAWPRVRDATSPREVREECARSSWRDAGSDDPTEILTHLRLEWARRLADVDAVTAPWGAGAAALVLARLFVEHGGPPGPDVVRRVPAIGRRYLFAFDLPDLVASLPDIARWPFNTLETPERLWRAEARWWQRLHHDGERLLRGTQPGLAVIAGAAGMLLADAWRTSAALDIASRGGGNEELLDAVA